MLIIINHLFFLISHSYWVAFDAIFALYSAKLNDLAPTGSEPERKKEGCPAKFEEVLSFLTPNKLESGLGSINIIRI